MKKNYFTLLLLLSSITIFSQTFNEFNNGAADGGLWTSAANWSLGVPIPAHTVRANNSATSFVNANFTVTGLQNLSGTTTDRFVNSSSGGVLTIDINNASTTNAIQNVSSNGVKLGLRGKINIQNTQASTFSRINSSNNAANSIEFENTSVLTLTTPLEVFKTNNVNGANNFFFNGKIEGGANFRVGANTTATFGNSVTNAGYTGELVLLGGASLVVNTTDDVVFYDGLKIQVNGTNASTTLNGQNVFNSGIVVGGTNVFNFNVNKNQNAMTNIVFQGAGTLNMAINNTVTSIAFADNSASAWLTGTLNITGYQPGVLRFGTTNGGLTSGQISQIVVDGSGGAVALDDNGYLVNASSLSTDDFKENTISPIAYPTLATDKIYFKTLQNDVKIFDLNGKMLLQNTSNNQTEATIDTLASGLYLIVFDSIKVEKFIKQ